MDKFILTSQISVRHFVRNSSQFIFHRTQMRMPQEKPLAKLRLFGYLFTKSLQSYYGNSRNAGEIKMAASPGGEEDSVYDTGRLSLFDLILERTRAQNKVRSNYLLLFV